MNRNNYQAVFDVTAYGAVADGTTVNTGAIQAALDACSQAGGGTVVVPPGTFLTGSIELKSHTTLFLENGSTLRFAEDMAEYPLIDTYWEGMLCPAHRPLIFADHAESVAITGQGTLDGSGSFWWTRHRSRTLRHPRPRFVGLQHCRHILIEQVRFCNSPSWTINPVYCDQVVINQITVTNPANSPNTDGINPDSCRNVHISNCHIDVGDDCITLKSGIEGRLPRVPCENIVITNCTMVHGHGGVVIGSEMNGGIRNVTISNCIFLGTDRGIRIKTRRRRGGLVENIRVSNIIMEKVLCPLVINMNYWGKTTVQDRWVWDEVPYAVDEGTPVIQHISLSQITAREIGAAAVFISGLPEMPLRQISLSDVAIEMAKDAEPGLPAMMYHLDRMAGQGLIARHTSGLSLINVRIEGARGEAYRFEQCTNISTNGCQPDPGTSAGKKP